MVWTQNPVRTPLKAQERWELRLVGDSLRVGWRFALAFPFSTWQVEHEPSHVTAKQGTEICLWKHFWHEIGSLQKQNLCQILLVQPCLTVWMDEWTELYCPPWWKNVFCSPKTDIAGKDETFRTYNRTNRSGHVVHELHKYIKYNCPYQCLCQC